MSLTKVSGAILKDPLNLGEVSIGGTLTYQDVTNVDSVGIITARSGINVSGGEIIVGSNIKIGNAGIITASSLDISGDITASSLDISGDIDVDGHTNLDNTNIVGVATVSSRLNINHLTYAGLSVAANDRPWRGQFMVKDLDTGNTSSPYMTFWNGNEDSSVENNTGLEGRVGLVNAGASNERFDVWSYRTGTPLSFATQGTERLRITSGGRVVIGNSTGTQPSATVAGAQFYGGSYPGDFRISSGAGASGTTTASIAIMGSNHNASIENGANSGAHLNLYNYNTTDGNSSGVMFMNSNGLAASRILGQNVSHSSRTGDIIFMVSNGSHPVQQMRLRRDGKLQIGNGTVTTSGTLNVKGNAVFDDGTNARVTLQADGTSTTQILSTTTNFGSYCNMKYQAADHIFQYGGNENARIKSDGTFEVGYLQPADGSSASRAAKSALEIKKHYPQKTSGNYWIIDNNGTARQIYCEMETDGGGWMLWHDHNAPGSKVSMNIALGGTDASPSGNLSRSNYNNYAYYTVWIKASQIDATGERLHSFVTLDANGAIKYVADYGSDFLLENVGDQYQPNRNDYFASNTTGEYVSNTQMYQPQCGATSWEDFSNGGWSEVYIREMDTRISPGDHRSLHLVERIYNFDSNGVPYWILAESMHPTPHWSDITLIQGEAADGSNPNIQTHNVEINSMNGNNGPSIRARSRGVLTGTFEYTFQLGYNWGWSIACLNATIGIENAIKNQSSDPYSAYSYAYYHASLYNNSSNNLWYPTSRAPWQNSDVNQSHSPGINYGNHVLWRESDGTIKARDKSGTHSDYTFPTKFAGPLILCSGSQSPHYTKLQSVWNTGNTYDSVSAFHGRNRWYK